MKKSLIKIFIILILISAFTSCWNILQINYNHILDPGMDLAFKDYFEENISENSIGSSYIDSVVEFSGQYILAYNESGPRLSGTDDFNTWSHYSSGVLGDIQSLSNLIVDGTTLIADAYGSILVVTGLGTNSEFRLNKPPIDWLTDWNNNLTIHNSTLYAVEWNRFYSSSDYGGSWDTIFDGEFDNLNGIGADSNGIYIGQSIQLLFKRTGESLWLTMSNFGTGDIGNINSIYSTDDTSYLATNSKGVVSSSDGFVNSIIYDSSDPVIDTDNFSFVAARDLSIMISDHNAPFLSTDGGTNWTKLYYDGVYHFPEISDLYIAVDGTLVVSTKGGLFTSTDNGANWTRTLHSSGFPAGGAHSLYAEGDTLYAGTAGGPAVSSDGGESWINADLSDGLGDYWCSNIFKIGATLYISGAGSLWESNNEGVSWAAFAGAPQLEDVYVNGIDIYGCSGSGVHIYDGVWTNYTTANGLHSDDIRSIHYDGTWIYALNETGVSVSNDGGSSWTVVLFGDSNDWDSYYKSIGQLGDTTYIGRRNEIISSIDGFITSEQVADGTGAYAFLEIEDYLFTKGEKRTEDDWVYQLGRIDESGFAPMNQNDWGALDGDSVGSGENPCMAVLNSIIWSGNHINLYFAEIIRPSLFP
jgi:hypothetical protein